MCGVCEHVFSVLADVTEVNEYRCLGFSDE